MANVPSRVVELVETFDRNIEAYRSPQYNETQLRREFIDPLFEELGWDVTNKQGFAPQYREVIHEDAIKIAGETKAPDYCFRIGGVRKFFLEAKKPFVNIDADVDPAYQLRRYAWSAKLPLSILTNFETFAVYDCQIRPKHTDRPTTTRIMNLTYKEYIDNWNEIADVFSKDAVQKGSFDKYAISTKSKRGTTTVDTEFLAEIEKWREMLAKIIALRNRSLSIREINFAVQQTIDRILFLRLCEDRGIETYGQLRVISSGDRNYPRLCEIFEKADQKYNSGLFHFTDEPDRPEPPDNLTLNLIIDDKDLKWILYNLYYPQSPYEFSVLPAEILGNVYEQFLGKVIRLTSGHRAVVEEKPEVKKAGGVYYTPSYIVDYIVKNTVGRLLGDASACHCEEAGGRRSNLKPLTPTQVSNIKILDPACGSGSFLIGVYQYLLDWHLRYYTGNDPEKHAKGRDPKIYEANSIRHCEEPGDEVAGMACATISNYRLTIAEKKRILLSSIFGVDIDSQAVEVTKLSLLLKVLEGESSETIENQYRLFHERALPDLAANIKCGNSLIGPDFFDTLDPVSITEELRQKINAFNWHAEFSEIFNRPNPGFDAVIGNPPYVRIQGLKDTQPQSIPYFSAHYHAASKGNYDIYVVFVEKGLNLLNGQGTLGYILPHKFFNAKYGDPLRKFIAHGKHLSRAVHFGHQQVFEGATTYTSLVFLTKESSDSFDFTYVTDLQDWRGGGRAVEGQLPAHVTCADQWHFSVGHAGVLCEKLAAFPTTLGDVADRIFQGFKTGADNVFILRALPNGRFFSKCLSGEVDLEPVYLRSLAKSGQLKRYNLRPAERSIVFPYQMAKLRGWEQIQQQAPKTAAYLKACKKVLEAREGGRWAGPGWYCYSRTQALEVMSSPKLLTADLNPSANYCFDAIGDVCFTGGAAGGYGIILSEDLRFYVFALLNSRLLDWFLHRISSTFRGGWFSYESRFISQLPIRTIDFDNRDDKAKHDRMVNLVEQMLDFHKELAAAKIPDEKTRIRRQIDATDKQIDQLVYNFYGLTEEEIKIVEGRATQ